MKKLSLFLVIFLTGVQLPIYGVESVKASISKESAKLSAADEKKLAEERKKVEEKKKDLNGTRWEVTIKPADPKEKETKDVFTFQDHQFQSEYLEKKGYTTTNYTNSPSNGKAPVFITLKTGKEGTSFVRGEWNKDVMSGVIHEQIVKDKETINQRYDFSSLKREAISATAVENKEPGLADPTAIGSTKALVSYEEKKVAEEKKESDSTDSM